MIMINIRKFLLSNSFKIFCLMGFVYQVSEISVEYFAYRTSTKVALQLENKFINPAIIFCPKYTDIIDRSNHEKYGIHSKARYITSEQLNDMSKLTIKDIFELTPDTNNTMIGCQFRNNEYNMDSYNRDQCYSMFQVTKYQEGAFICYQFRTRIPDNQFSCEQAALSFHSLNELYSIQLHPRFFLSNRIKGISFIPDVGNSSFFNMPIISRRFYSTFVRFGSSSPDTSIINYISLSGDVYSITRLKKPYDTACVRNNEETEYACRRNCNIASFKKHNIFPPNELTTEPLPLKHSKTIVTSLNTTLVREIKMRNQKCMKSCNERSMCEDWYTVTIANLSPSRLLNTISISCTCSNRPAVFIEYLAKVILMDFIMYVSSAFGIWFGISILSINPFKNTLPKSNNSNTKFNRTLNNRVRDKTNVSQLPATDSNRELQQLGNISH